MCIVIYTYSFRNLTTQKLSFGSYKRNHKSGYLWDGGVGRKKTISTVFSSFKFCAMCIYDQIQILKHLIKQPPTLYT